MKNEKLELALKVWKVMNGYATREEVLDEVNSVTADHSIEEAEEIIFSNILRWADNWFDPMETVIERMHTLRNPVYMKRHIESLTSQFLEYGMHDDPIFVDDEPLPF